MAPLDMRLTYSYATVGENTNTEHTNKPHKSLHRSTALICSSARRLVVLHAAFDQPVNHEENPAACVTGAGKYQSYKEKGCTCDKLFVWQRRAR